MDEYERDEISKGFADLMAALEGVAAGAIESQSAERPLALLRDDVNHLWHMLFSCVSTLAPLERRLDKEESSQP